MKLLICLWLAFLQVIPLTEPLPSDEMIHDMFLDRVEDGYLCYATEWTYDDPLGISIVVVKGIYNNMPCYGISFVSYNYDIVLSNLDGYYTIINNDNRSASILAIKADMTYELLIYSKKGEIVELPNKVLLKKFAASDINQANYIQGNNNFKALEPLKPYSFKMPFYMNLIIVFCSVTGLSLFGILLMFILKKGFFDRNKRKEGILDIKGILEGDTLDTANEDFLHDVKEFQEIEKIEEEIKAAQIEDVKAYLQSLGFVTEYKILSEEEKNKIMLELMRLKDNQQISLNKYYEETSELWKK